MTALLMIPCNFITPEIFTIQGRTKTVHVNTVNKIALAIMCVGLAGCASMPGTPGRVTETTAKLDGERQIHVDPGWLLNGISSTTLKLGGFWSSKAPTNFVLRVVYDGVADIDSIQVSINGSIQALKPSDYSTDIDYIPGYNYPGHNESSRCVVVPLSFIEQLVAAENVVFRVNMRGHYAEGVFSTDRMTSARPGFRKALSMIAGQPVASK